MRIKEIKNEKLGESVFTAVHPSGLRIFVMPKAGYDSVYAFFDTQYGSIDTAIKNENGEFETIPAGTAHFLEHKLFESEDLNAFERFAETGASANAFTSFENTGYLFKSSGDVEKSLEILIDFVQNPYFTAETVQKEQGIIGQEIRMYQDLPDWKIMFNLLKILYSDHPVRIDIAGTQESIAEIDADLLYRLYNKFYNTSNMVLSVVGGIEPEKVFEIVDRVLKNKEGEPICRQFIKENPVPEKDYVEEALSVSKKQFMLGFKEDISEPELSLKDEITSDIMLDAICGQSSDLFRKLMDEKLIDRSFDGSLFNGFGYSCVLFAGTSDEPEKVSQMIKDEIERLKKEGIDPDAFSRAKKKFYGSYVGDYNSISAIANRLASLHFSGYKPFDEIKICSSVTLKDAQKRLEALKNEYSALSIIRPI